jgi:hypothetical protein
MKFLRYTFIIILCVFCLGLIGCNEDSSSDQATVSNEVTNADLILGTWQMRAATVDPGFDFGTGTPITDFYVLMDDCVKDDAFIYTSNRTFTVDEGATKCNSADPQTTEGTYQLSDDGNTITQIRNGETEVITITSLDESQMTGETIYLEAGTEYTVTLAFEKL